MEKIITSVSCDAMKWRSFLKKYIHVCDHVQCLLSKSHAFLICKRLLCGINNYCVIIILAFKAIYFVLNIWQLWSTGSLRSEGQMWNSGHCRTSLEVTAAELTLPSVWPPHLQIHCGHIYGMPDKSTLEKCTILNSHLFVHLLIIILFFLPILFTKFWREPWRRSNGSAECLNVEDRGVEDFSKSNGQET